jgi:hypothetical protein
MNESKVIFDAKKLATEMFEKLRVEQTNRLVEYAKAKIIEIGDKIQTYHSKNHMDRTGNLLNSLCWCVTYGTGEDEKYSGFYRQETLHGGGIDKTSESWLHEFFSNDREEVKGHQLAQSFIDSYKGKDGKWTVTFAILAPYWGYWEGGFKMKMGGSTVYKGEPQQRNIPLTTRFMQFQVMSHVYDEVRRDLRPAETHITVYRPKYSYKNPKYKKKKGYKKIGIIR